MALLFPTERVAEFSRHRGKRLPGATFSPGKSHAVFSDAPAFRLPEILSHLSDGTAVLSAPSFQDRQFVTAATPPWPDLFSDDLALLASLPGISRQASHEAVADFLTLGYIPALRTIYQEIRKIPAGHQFLHGEMRRIPLPDTLTELPMHFDEAMEFFRNRLKALPGEILERHPQLDVMLSGGIDSGTLLELLQEFYPDDSRKAITAVFQERTTMNSP